MDSDPSSTGIKSDSQPSLSDLAMSHRIQQADYVESLTVKEYRILTRTIDSRLSNLEQEKQKLIELAQVAREVIHGKR